MPTEEIKMYSVSQKYETVCAVQLCHLPSVPRCRCLMSRTLKFGVRMCFSTCSTTCTVCGYSIGWWRFAFWGLVLSAKLREAETSAASIFLAISIFFSSFCCQVITERTDFPKFFHLILLTWYPIPHKPLIQTLISNQDEPPCATNVCSLCVHQCIYSILWSSKESTGISPFRRRKRQVRHGRASTTNNKWVQSLPASFQDQGMGDTTKARKGQHHLLPARYGRGRDSYSGISKGICK